jgi:hypothetical protein
MNKILKPVASSSDESAGDKNEILVDFRIGFSESQSILTYFNIADIFSKLGGIIGSTLVIIFIIITIRVLFFIYDFAALLKRKSGHKFRNQTILKYKRALP